MGDKVNETMERFVSYTFLERGLNYYEEGYVTSLEQTLTGYTAVVGGTEDYDVEIEIRDGRVYDMTCTCPYAAEENYCRNPNR